MRRRTGPKERSWRPYDTRKDLKPEWLASLGAVNVAWNDIEGAIDVATCIALELPHPLWMDVTSRINGLDGKFALIKKSARVHFKFPDEICALIDASIGAIAEHKGYRDSLIHARIIDPDAEVAGANQSKGTEYEIIVSQTALDRLYSRLEMLQHESDDLLNIFHHRAIIFGLKREESQIAPNDPRIRSALQSIRQYAALIREHQNARRALPQLPQFPQEHRAPAATATDPQDRG